MPLCTHLDPRGTLITEDGFSSLGLHDAALSCSSFYFTAKLSRSPSLGLSPSCDLHMLELLRLGHGTCSFLLKWPRTVGISWINEPRISAASLWRTKAGKTWFPLSGTPRFLPGSNLRSPPRSECHRASALMCPSSSLLHCSALGRVPVVSLMVLPDRCYPGLESTKPKHTEFRSQVQVELGSMP